MRFEAIVFRPTNRAIYMTLKTICTLLVTKSIDDHKYLFSGKEEAVVRLSVD